MHLAKKAKKFFAAFCALSMAFTAAPFTGGSPFSLISAAASESSTVTYDFRDGSIVPKNTDGKTDVTSDDGKLTVKGGPSNAYAYNGAQHGVQFKAGNSIEIKVDGPTKVTVGDCRFNGVTELTLKNATNTYSKTETVNVNCYDQDGSAAVFEYDGSADTLIIDFTGSTYVPVIITEPFKVFDPSVPPETIGNGKADVWDFGAEELDTELYNNMLTADIINGFYPEGTAAGSSGVSIGGFATPDGELLFEANGKTNNRIRTNNESITRYDSKTINIDGTALTGMLYSNSSSTKDVYLGIKLYANDILTLYLSSNGGASTINFESPSGDIQEGQSSGSGAKLTFYAPEDGIYKIYSIDEKLTVWRAIREHATPVKVTGTVDISSAEGIADKDYKLCFTNTSSGSSVEVAPKNGEYTVYLYDSYSYEMSLVDANGYIIKNNAPLKIAKGSSDVTNDLALLRVDLVTVTGKLTGLTDDALSKLELSFVNSKSEYVPEFTIKGSDITVLLEKGVEYTITAEGINDYELSGVKTIKADEDGTQDIAFALKPVYAVNVTISGIPESAASTAALTFTNLNEEGYVYKFAAGETPKLRDGTYSVKVAGTGSVAYAQKVTSNLKVDGAAVSKTIEFEPIEEWDFSKYNGNPGIDTIGDNKYYLGLELSAANVLENKTYLLLNKDGEIKIPVKKDQTVIFEYCYQAAFEVNGRQVLGASGSTTKFETSQAVASEDGFMTVKGIDGTTEDGKSAKQTYFTKITVKTAAEYKPTITVGEDKDYQTINDALAAAAQMSRPNDERVEIVIDPGNYEEMLVINIPNVSLINAAGKNSSLEIINKGVDIGKNVVRITSYYGHGYSYYSMGSDCKWNADVLAANKANGYNSTKNPGSGTTNGSYWNSTVVVMGDGFEADGIVFENSFNQYISEKEANDIVVMEEGNKGKRPTTAGDTSVQKRSFVERAAALSVVGDKAVFNNCKFIGRQDTLYGGQNIKTVFQKCDILGAVDFIFGGMNAVFYQCNLVMNTDSSTASDQAYLTAAQQSSGRGYLMYNCTVTSTTPGVDTASETRSKPGYFGRPWAANTSEVVFYNTVIETTDYPGSEGKSLIEADGWKDSLGGKSDKMYEYGTIEKSGEDNSASRAEWSTLLDTPSIDGGETKITIKAFLGDEWTDELNERGLVLELVEFKDEATGIEAIVNEDTFENPEDITFNVDPVEDETDDDTYTFDISFVDADGNKVQPNGEVTIMIPVPETLKDKTFYVYHEEAEGKYASIDFTIEDDVVVFTASHFSKYILTTEKLDEKKEDDTSKPEDGKDPSDDNSNSSDDSSTGNDSADNSGNDSNDGNDGNPSTGATTGIAVSFAVLAAVTSAALVISKKKKK